MLIHFSHINYIISGASPFIDDEECFYACMSCIQLKKKNRVVKCCSFKKFKETDVVLEIYIHEQNYKQVLGIGIKDKLQISNGANFPVCCNTLSFSGAAVP